MFNDYNAPLAKLARILARRGYQNAIVAWEEERYDPGATDTWEGLCEAWAVAAGRIPEPTATISVSGEVLKISDQKAILTKLHQLFPRDVYGVIYRGDAATDGTYQALRPEAFHRLASVMLGERRRALVMDDDPGIEVWSKPVYRMKSSFAIDPSDRTRVKVRTHLYTLNQRRGPSEDLTGIGDVVQVLLEYNLYIDRQDARGGGFRVVAGEWTGNAYEYHPDVLVVPKANGSLRSANTELNAHIGAITSILNL